jgi:acetylornithine/N-succinyldiaminopimelate aminotransferase
MAAANAVVDVMLADGFFDRTRKVADYFWEQLKPLVAKHPKVFTEVRGKGLMIGLKCVPTNSDVIARAMDNGLLMVAAGDNVVRLVPPLIISEAEVDAAVAVLDRTATELAASTQ